MEKVNEKIKALYNDYISFDKVVKEKNKVVTEKQNSIKDLIDGKSVGQVEDVLVHIYVDTILYNKDLQILFFRLISNIETYLEFSDKPLDEDIATFYKDMKNWAPKRIFMLEKGEVVETEEGTLDKARKEFIDSEFFKNLIKQVNK